MSTNKTFNKVQLDVKFTQATSRVNLISEENISISFGKISKYFADLHSQAFTGYTHPTYTARTGKPTGNQTPGFGSTFTISQITSDGTGHVTAATDRTVKIPDTTMGAASADAAGSKGLVPAPAAGKQTSFLRGDGTWAVPTNTDTKVTQSQTTTTNYRPILFGANNSTNVSTLANTITDQAYTSTKMYAQPSTGLIFCTGRKIENVTIQTGSTKHAHITLQTLMTWLITTKTYIPSGQYCHVIISTTWEYANNDILQVSIDGTNYEIQLAGVIIEFIGGATSYNAGMFRLLIHSSPTINFTATSGYSKFPVSTIAEYTCNGSDYSPTWKKIWNSHPTYTSKSSGLYKITVDGTGHVSAATAVAKADITALGIPGSDTNTTYTIATGDSNGQIKVTPSSGSAYNVSVKGLGSAAYTASTSYVQTHVGANFNVAKSGYFAVMANENSDNPNSLLPTQNEWWHILSMSWNSYDSTNNSDATNWVSQLAIPTYQNKLIGMKWRTNSSGGSALTRDDWVTVLDERNSPAFKAITQRQLRVTGGVGWYRILTLPCPNNNGQLMNDIKIFVRRHYNNGTPESFSAHIVNNYSATPPIYITHAIQASKYFTQIRVSKASDGKYQYVEIYYNSSNPNAFVIQYNYIAPYSLATSAYGSPVYPTDNTDVSPITDSPTAMTTVNIPTNVMQANYKSDGTYWGLVSPKGEEGVWIRTSTNGLIPSTTGGATRTTGSSLGTSTWYFLDAYIKNVYTENIGAVTVDTTSLENKAGSFVFKGSNLLGNTYDWVGIQADAGNDKFQIMANTQLMFRQNDTGGTSTAWNSWVGCLTPNEVIGSGGITVTKTDVTVGSGDTAFSYKGQVTLSHTNSVTAGTAKGDDSKTLAFGGTFTIPSITYDANGHITAKGTTTMTMPSNPNSDTKVKVTTSTSKAYLIGTTTSPDGTAVEGVGNTGVYMTNGVLTASSIYGSGAESQSTAPTGGYRIYDCRSVNVSPNDGDKAVNFYFHMTDMPDTSLWWSVLHMRGWTGAYAAWEIAGPSDNKDQRTKPLYVRTSNTNTAWGSWRKIYDTSNPPTASEVGALASTTKYAGSSSAGGAATSANKLNTDAGGTYLPVYFSSGVPVAVTVKNNTSVGTIGWTSGAAGNAALVTVNSIAYWNGAYSGTTSNLAYCKQGAFGTIVTKSTTDYSKVTSSTTNGKIKIDGTDTTVYTHPSHTSKTSGLYKITVDTLGHVSSTASVAKGDIPALDYLPLSGGTMTGDITFTGAGTSSYPSKSKGIYWGGGTDAIDMYYNLRASDAGELIINMRDDSNVRTSFAYNGTVKSYIDTNGTYNGNASTATKLETARNIALAEDFAGSANFDGSGNISISGTFYRCSAFSNNTANYPWHRIAYRTGVTDIYNDTDAIFMIRACYNGGPFGIIKVTMRTNGSGTNCQVAARWLVRQNIAANDVYIAQWGKTGQSVYADIFLKGTTYNRAYVYQIAGSRWWTLVNSNEASDTTTSDKKTSTEVYASIAAAGTTLHNQAYTQTVAGIDQGHVNSANSATYATLANYLDVVAGNEIRFYNDNQFKEARHFWLGYSWADGSHYTPSGGSDTSSTTAPNITKFVMGNCSAGGLASVHANTFILGNGISPTLSSKTTTITTAATTTDRTITLPDDSGTVALTSKTFNVTRGFSVSTATTGYWAAMCCSTQAGSPTLPTAAKWWHVISMDWTNNDTNNWISQLAVATMDGSGVWWRRNNASGTSINSSTWHRLAEGDSSGNAVQATKLRSSAARTDSSVGTADTTPYQKYWVKIASCYTTENCTDLESLWAVNDVYGNRQGILKVRARVEGTAGTFGNTRTIRWLVADNSIDVNRFAIVCYNNRKPDGTEATGTATVELWWKSTGQYASFSFVLLDETRRTGKQPNDWTLYDTSTYGQAALPTTGNITYSVAATILNSTTGNAATATKATTIATEVGSSAGARPVFYGYLGDNTRVVYNTNFTYNPSGNVLTATTFAGALSGNATSANKLNTNAGATYRPVYFSGGVPVECDAPASGSFFKGVPSIGTDGVMEIGRYIDFHTTNASTADYDYRIDTATTAMTLHATGSFNTLTIKSPGSTQLSFQTTSSGKAYTASGITCYPLGTTGMTALFNFGGNVVIGGGEAAKTLYDNDYDTIKTVERETLYLASDSEEIHFITGAQTYAGRKVLKIIGDAITASGLTLTNSGYGPLKIVRSDPYYAGIKFYNNTSTYLGSLAIATVNGTFHRFKTDESTMYEIIDRSVVRNNTTVGTLGWTSSSADTVIPTVNTIAYWNGAYSGTSSNLAYCKKGEFGTIVTKSTTDYSKVSISRNLTSGTKVGTITIDGTATDLYCQTNSDTKVTQNIASGSANLPLLMSYYQTDTAVTAAQVVYRNNSIYANPSAGSITANKFYGDITGDGLNAGIYDLLNTDNPIFNGTEWMLTSIPSSSGGTSTPAFRRVKTAKFADYVTSNSRDVLFNDSTNTSKSITLSNPPTDTQYLKLYFKSSGNSGQPSVDNSVYSIAEVPYMTGVKLGGILQVAQSSDNQGVLRLTALAFTVDITTGNPYTLRLIKVSKASRISGSGVSDDSSLSANIIKVVAYR